MKQTPLIRYSPLGCKWFVITKYKQKAKYVEAVEKFDVTDQMEQIMKEVVKRERKRRKLRAGKK